MVALRHDRRQVVDGNVTDTPRRLRHRHLPISTLDKRLGVSWSLYGQETPLDSAPRTESIRSGWDFAASMPLAPPSKAPSLTSGILPMRPIELLERTVKTTASGCAIASCYAPPLSTELQSLSSNLSCMTFAPIRFSFRYRLVAPAGLPSLWRYPPVRAPEGYNLWPEQRVGRRRREVPLWGSSRPRYTSSWASTSSA